MKKVLNIIIQIILYIWQLPQNIVGLLFLVVYYGGKWMKVNGIRIYYNEMFPGGISLGSTIIVYKKTDDIVNHEHGHQIQSLYLGPLYLFVIGIPSIIWAGLYGSLIKRTRNGYYRFYTEKWADKLGGVVRI